MKFLDTGEKIKKLRKELNIKQEELNAAGVSRNFISMIENGKRKLPVHVANSLMDIFRKRAAELGVELGYDEQWLMSSSKEQAEEFCIKKLESQLSPEDIDILTTIVKEYDIEHLVPQIYILKAEKLYSDRLYESAFTYYYDVLEYVRSNIEQKAFIYNKLGKCKTKMFNYVEAIAYFNKCYELSLTNDDSSNKRNCLYNMAVCYRKLKKVQLALECVEELVKLCSVDKDFEEYIGAIILMSNCYIDLGKFKEAINILSSSIDAFTDPKHKLLGYIYNSLGSLYLDIDELEAALAYLNKAYSIREISDIYNLPRTILNKANLFLKEQNIEAAIELTNKAISLAQENQDFEFIIRCYKMLEKIYIEDECMLRSIYLKMIDVFKNTNNSEEMLRVYIKLLSISYGSDNIDEYKSFLADAAGYVTKI